MSVIQANPNLLKVAILKVADTCQLTITRTNPSLTKNAIAVSYSLDPSNVLTQTSAKLASMEIDELWVVLQSSITLREETEHLVTRNIGTGANERMAVFHNKDIEKLKYLGEHLEVSKLKIFDLLDIFGEMSEDNRLVLCGDYYGGKFSYICCEDGKVLDYKVWRTADIKQVRALATEYNTKEIVSIYNNLLEDKLKEVITNWDYLDNDEQQLFAISLGTLLVEPIKEYGLVNGILRETLDRSSDRREVDREIVEEIDDDNDEEEYEEYPSSNVKPNSSINRIKFPKFLDMSEDIEKSNGLGNIVLNFIGIVLSATLACSIIANKQLPRDIDYLDNKNNELNILIQPKQDTVDYYTKFESAMENKQPNIDGDYLTKIKSIEVDGLLLAGIQIQKDNIGLVVFLKDESQIDAYTQELSKIITIPQVVKKGTVTLESTTLTKFVINGKR